MLLFHTWKRRWRESKRASLSVWIYNKEVVQSLWTILPSIVDSSFCTSIHLNGKLNENRDTRCFEWTFSFSRDYCTSTLKATGWSLKRTDFLSIFFIESHFWKETLAASTTVLVRAVHFSSLISLCPLSFIHLSRSFLHWLECLVVELSVKFTPSFSLKSAVFLQKSKP